VTCIAASKLAVVVDLTSISLRAELVTHSKVVLTRLSIANIV